MDQLQSKSSIVPRWMQRVHEFRGLLVPVGFVVLMFVVLVPMPPWLMDILIAANISLATIILLTSVYMSKPLDFSVFPSLLLATTLLRLVLNIASTRLILSADADTPESAIAVAGNVIGAFGNFVAGDSLFVGVVIFLILIIVQFVVITKGATRISEVAARFTLDAMPGKQMAIDSDLNAGIIDESEARQRREEIRREADFFGAMDGASKFVRGDAIAGILITAVNIIGGFAVGAIERGWPAGQSAEVFTRLTIGDGLSSQIPSFIIAIASALIVTRSGSKDELGNELTDQLISQPKGLVITSIFLLVLAASPLPTIPLMVIGLGLGGLAFSLRRAMVRTKREQEERDRVPEDVAPPAPKPEELIKVDALELEVGYALVPLVDSHQGGDLLDRITAIRRQLAVELGFVMPPVRIRDNMQLKASEYQLKIRGCSVAKGEIIPGKLLAMDPGIASGPIQGIETHEPAFGLDAWWIEPNLRQRAETMNYTVVEPSSVLATHMTEVIRDHASELLTREEVSNLVEQLKEKAPKLVEEAVPAVVKLAELQKIMQNLLSERVPVRDLETIVETLADWSSKTSDLDVLTEYVRHSLRRTISHLHAAPSDSGKLRLVCVTLDPSLEDVVASYIDRGANGTTVSIPAQLAGNISRRIASALDTVANGGHQPVVLTAPRVRAVVHNLASSRVPKVTVLGYNEVTNDIEVESVEIVSLNEVASETAEAA